MKDYADSSSSLAAARDNARKLIDDLQKKRDDLAKSDPSSPGLAKIDHALAAAQNALATVDQCIIPADARGA